VPLVSAIDAAPVRFATSFALASEAVLAFSSSAFIKAFTART
jgi:hypothetical protein